MKKTLFVLVMALVTLTCVFAENANFAEKGELASGPSTVSATATLDLKNSDFAGYTFGFSSTAVDLGSDSDTNVTGTTPAYTLDLEFSNGSATGSLYYYYKIRSSKKVNLTLTASPLVGNANGDVNKTGTTLGYTINDGAAHVIGTEGSSEIFNVNIEKGIVKKTKKMDFTVSNLTVANIGCYEATMTMTLSVVG